MRRLAGITVALTVALVGSIFAGGTAMAATCTETTFVRDSHNLTARLVNPTGTVSGTVDAGATVDSPATCDIGIYYGPGSTGVVDNATIQDATYFGIVNDGGNVSISNSTVTQIGDMPFTGNQHGTGILFEAGTGAIRANTVQLYQKNGIVLNLSGSSATIAGNTVSGRGPDALIAQNGIQVSRGAKATVTGNTVTDHQYTGPTGVSSAGILVTGGPWLGSGTPFTVGSIIKKNTVTTYDVGIWLFNANSDFTAPSTATNETVKFNTVSNAEVTNTTGFSTTPPCGYQVGIADLGKKDLIVNNSVSGTGYTKVPSDCPFLRFIDVTTKARGVPSNK